VLFWLYMDDLLVALSTAGVRCFIGDNFVGALAYADDITLRAPSASELICLPFTMIMPLNTACLLTQENQNV